VFEIRQRGSTLWREILGGVTTFMAMSYILFVQPGVLRAAGMDMGGVFMATCISSAAACLLMGVLANYPIALAPGMGAWGAGVGWQMALALTAVAGAVFLALSMVSFRSRVMNAIPDSLKSGIAAGIGLFIAVIGFHMGNLVVKAPGEGLSTFPGLRDNPAAWLTLIGLGVTMLLMAFHVRGALLVGILATTAAALAMEKISWCGSPVALPSGLGKTAGGLFPGFAALWREMLSGHAMDVLVFAFVLLFMDLFDTVGTLVGVASRAGLMRNGRLPKGEAAMSADAAGTIVGACLGTSTVTSYIESVTGVTAGARTGLAALVAALCMLAALLFQPVVEMIGGGIAVTRGGAMIVKHPMIAPALIVVGSMMIRTLREIDWEDATEYLPAFLTMVTMPLTFSISHGIAIGFVSYAFGKLVTGRARQCPWLVYVFAALFVVRYLVAS